MIYHVYAGSYMGENGGDGIYLLELDTEKKELNYIKSYPDVSDNPSFLVVTKDNVYAVSELPDHGYVTAFSRDFYTGELKRLNQIQTEGSAMCHLCLWPNKRFISASNYMSGNFVVCHVEEDGKLGGICDFKQHSGIGYESRIRQEGPHMHATQISVDGKRLYAADLGLDQIFCYEIKENGSLHLADAKAQIKTPGGMGPRHFIFSEDGRFLYLVTEMGSRLFVYESVDKGETYQEIQNLSTLPKQFTDFSIGADIHFSADGKFLYTSNRGANTIAAFRISENDGKAEPCGQFDCGGDFPRNFCITPDDRFVIVANQNSGNLVLFERNKETGILESLVMDIQIPKVVFVDAIQKIN